MVSKRTTKAANVSQKQAKKLTDYFSRKNTDPTTSTRSTSPMSSLSSSPAPVSDRGSAKNEVLTVPSTLFSTRKSSRLSALKGSDVAISPGSSTRTSASSKSFSKGSTTSISSISVRSSSRKPDPTPSNEPRVTRYRTRQTDSNGVSLSKRPSAKFRSASLQVAPAKPATKRKKPPSHDSDIEEPEGVVYVPRTNFTGPPVMKENLRPDRSSLSPASKKLKLDPRFSVVYAPSSLSEEHELTLPPSVKRLPEVKENVQRWRASSISFPLPPPPDVEMEDISAQGDVDDESMIDDFVPSSQSQPYLESISCTLPTPSPELPAEALTAIMSPAPSSLTPLGSTPAHQSPVPSPPPSSPPRKSSVSYRPLSPPPSDLPEEPMADASEDDDEFIERLKAEVAAQYSLPSDSDGMSLPDMSDDSSSEEELHWSPGARKASTSTSRTTLTSTTLFSNSGRPMRQHKAPTRQPVTLTKAPNKIANPLKELLKQHKKAEKGGYSTTDLRRAEEHINAIKDMKIDDPLEEFPNQDTLPIRTSIVKRGESTAAILDSQAVVTILGEDEGAVVGQILQNDKRNKLARRRETKSGIELFDHTERNSKKGKALVKDVKFITADASDAVFTRFRNAVERNDVPAVMLMLNHGLVKRIKPSNRGSCLRWLLEQAFTSSDEMMQEAMYHALSTSHFDHPLPLAAFVSTLVTLGAKPDVLTAAGFDVKSSNTHRTRAEPELLLEEWLNLIKRLSDSITFDDVSGMVTLLCIVALDRSLTPSLRRLASASIETLAERSVPPQMERFVCTSLLKLASNLSTPNKAALVVALGNGSPTIRRISRWLSTAVIVEGTIIPEDLNTLGPASKIRGYLESPQGGLMDTQGSEEVDFENVTDRVILLSAALTDITRQLEQEVRAGASDLNAVGIQLGNLHAKIVDTRAAHLDRSRAKAALQTLSFRVRYQVAAAQDSSLHRGKLQAYWAPTNSQ